MPSSWNVYYVIFLSALLALCIPLFLTGVSFLVSPRRMTAPSPSPVPIDASSTLGKRMNTRFFLGVNAALALIALSLVLLPCVGMLQPAMGRLAIVRGLIAISSIGLFAALGLFYSVRKGDMRWLDTYRGTLADEVSPGLGGGE